MDNYNTNTSGINEGGFILAKNYKCSRTFDLLIGADTS